MTKALLLSKDEIRRNRLLLVIEKKKILLLQLSTSVEILKTELESIKREYYLRVGSLLNRDNDLDLEMIKLKNILACLRNGMSYKEALESLKGSFYSEEEYSTTFTDNDYAPSDFQTDTKGEMLKALWKRIVTKFHPDLTLDPDEKKRRESIMKQVNNAYAAGDLGALEEIENTNPTLAVSELSIEDLERMIIQLENSILKLRSESKELKKTEWYVWRKKIARQKEKGDIFKELEHALLDDIVKKINLLNSLKREINRHR